MDIRQLEAFAAVMTIGSLTAAGALLGRSQPTMTREIKELEAELGYPLFDRNGPRISPTHRAFLLQEEVSRTLVGFKHLAERAAALAVNDVEPVLHLSAIPAMSTSLVPAALRRIPLAERPRQCLLRSAPAEQIVHAVVSRTVDIGIASLPIDHPGLDLKWIGEIACVAVVPLDDPLAKQPVIALGDLHERDLITTTNAFRLKGRIDAALRAAGVEHKPSLETNNSINAIFAARAGLGVAIIEQSTAATGAIEGVAIRPLDVHIPFYFTVVTPIAKPLTPAVERVLEALRDAAIDSGITLHGAQHHLELSQAQLAYAPVPDATMAARPEPRN